MAVFTYKYIPLYLDQLISSGTGPPTVNTGTPDPKNLLHQPKSDIKIIKGESAKILCEIFIPDDVAKRATYTFTVDVEYGYEITDSVKVTVEPKI